MGDMGDIFNAMREHNRERKKKNWHEAFAKGTEAWTVHTQFHWSRMVAGSRLDYWPSTNKWMWKGRKFYGTREDVDGFIRNRESLA